MAKGIPSLVEITTLSATLIAPIRDTPFERFFFRDPNGYIFEVIPTERATEGSKTD